MRRQAKNQCDGCRAGRPLDKNGNHVMGDGEYPDLMACQKSRYEAQGEIALEVEKLPYKADPDR